MASVRAAIRAALPASSLTDPAGYARALERAYVKALRAKAPEVLRDTGEATTPAS
jgi:hypothetical protein